MDSNMRADGSPKMSSIQQMARYPLNTVLYRVVLRPLGPAQIQIPPGEEWLNDAHPKVLFERGYASKGWKFRAKLPKLCAIDFQYVTELLTNELVIERFVVMDIHRSDKTGEFYYANGDGDWMPESTLITTPEAAKREKLRIKNLFKLWCNRSAIDEV